MYAYRYAHLLNDQPPKAKPKLVQNHKPLSSASPNIPSSNVKTIQPPTVKTITPTIIDIKKISPPETGPMKVVGNDTVYHALYLSNSTTYKRVTGVDKKFQNVNESLGSKAAKLSSYKPDENDSRKPPSQGGGSPPPQQQIQPSPTSSSQASLTPMIVTPSPIKHSPPPSISTLDQTQIVEETPIVVTKKEHPPIQQKITLSHILDDKVSDSSVSSEAVAGPSIIMEEEAGESQEEAAESEKSDDNEDIIGDISTKELIERQLNKFGHLFGNLHKQVFPKADDSKGNLGLKIRGKQSDQQGYMKTRGLFTEPIDVASPKQVQALIDLMEKYKPVNAAETEKYNSKINRVNEYLVRLNAVSKFKKADSSIKSDADRVINIARLEGTYAVLRFMQEKTDTSDDYMIKTLEHLSKTLLEADKKTILGSKAGFKLSAKVNEIIEIYTSYNQMFADKGKGKSKSTDTA